MNINWQWTGYILGGLAAVWLLGAVVCIVHNVIDARRRRERRR